MYFLHRDVEFDSRSKRTGNLQIQISLFSYLQYTVSLTRRLKRNESTTLIRKRERNDQFFHLHCKISLAPDISSCAEHIHRNFRTGRMFCCAC